MPSSWPALPPYEQWAATCDTLHAHTQVLGKLAAVLAPPEPQLQHAALRLTARGWETLPLPAPDGSGSFDLAVNLFSGEPADPPSGDFIMRNAMDSQEVAVGWWPGDARYAGPAFYAYAHPAPEGFSDAELPPAQARWDPELGLYVLDWDAVTSAADPHLLALQFA